MRVAVAADHAGFPLDRKSTRLNSSHANISYAVFCLIRRLPRSPLFPYTTLFRSIGRRDFGASAPIKDLWKNFGFTAEHVIAEAHAMLRGEPPTGGSSVG